MANGTKKVAPAKATNVLRIFTKDKATCEEQYDAVPGLNAELNKAVANRLPGDPSSYDIELAAFILSNGDTYLVPVSPKTGVPTEPPGATPLPGGLTIQRYHVNPNYCYVDMGGWGFYYEC